ncbi:AAA family ATPase [Cardiobacteriaceae bacterium TAE3-ERU3]|nr:AAA family ATPase [Cardiobacteriaceae bacterium TAE3-ERU3]
MEIRIVDYFDEKTNPKNIAFLIKDNWDDFGFKTKFYLVIYDEKGKVHNIGSLKIGFKGQAIDTHEKFIKNTDISSKLNGDFFSVGGDSDYYKNIVKLPNPIKNYFLMKVRDIVYCENIIEEIIDENVFSTSLLRFTSLSTIKGQFKRIIDGKAELTDYNFSFLRRELKDFSDIDLEFSVKANSIPSTNIHAIIGRNGIGKTSILNNMVKSIVNKEYNNNVSFYENYYNILGRDLYPISTDYFSRLVTVSFSAFDTFIPPENQPDPAKGTCYFYIGLKDNKKNGELKTTEELREEFYKALDICINSKKDKWLKAVNLLESDSNFKEINISELGYINKEFLEDIAIRKLNRMSSGHVIVLLTITHLIANLEEKTLVLIDEPESHLHPPLLSAFIRTLSSMLLDYNGIAIIATHSPVVLQEVPKSCVWKLTRSGSVMKTSRPEIETFGENVGVLTRDVFGLEVEKSGFYNLLEKSVTDGSSFHEIIRKYNDQLGLEAKFILNTLIQKRDSDS